MHFIVAFTDPISLPILYSYDLNFFFLVPGTTVSAAENALVARKASLEYLEKRLSRITELDEEMQDALRVYDTSVPREPQWGEDFFGIDPFYIAAGEDSNKI